MGRHKASLMSFVNAKCMAEPEWGRALKVRSMASSLRRSSVSMSCLILASPRAFSSCRRASSARWSVNAAYWSSALRFTCLNRQGYQGSVTLITTETQKLRPPRRHSTVDHDCNACFPIRRDICTANCKYMSDASPRQMFCRSTAEAAERCVRSTFRAAIPLRHHTFCIY